MEIIQQFEQTQSTHKLSPNFQILKPASGDQENTSTFSFSVPQFCQSEHGCAQVHAQYIKNVTSDLHFSKEVVRDRGLACLPYKEWDVSGLYDVSDLKRFHNQKMVKIHPPRTVQHKLCHMINASPAKQVKSKSHIGFGNSIWKRSVEHKKTFTSNSLLHSKQSVQPITLESEETDLSTKLKKNTKSNSEMTYSSCSPSKDLVGLDEQVLKMARKTPAQWIVDHKTNYIESSNKICTHHRSSPLAEIIRDEHTAEENSCKEQEDSTKRREDTTGFNNKTADSITVKHFELSPSLRLQDLMNPKAGKYIYATQNSFEGELYSGASKIRYQKNDDKKKHILMESHNQYDKHLQELLPKSHKEPQRGAIRWVALPTPALDETRQSCSELPAIVHPQEGENEIKREQQYTLSDSQALWNVLTQWKTAWMFSGNWKDTTVEQIKKDLSSVHNSPKITALVTLMAAAVVRQQEEAEGQTMRQSITSGDVTSLAAPGVTEGLLSVVDHTLSDADALVRMAAAMCCYLSQSVSAEARKVMLSALAEGTNADSWAAAQCLALEGDHSYMVIKRIITQLFEGKTKDTEKQVIYILRKISANTNLVHDMLADVLNNGNWRDRAVACKALCHLQGHAKQKEEMESDLGKPRAEALSMIGWLKLMTAQLFPAFLSCFSDEFVAVRKQACLTAGLLQIREEMVMNSLCHLIQNDPVWKIQAFAIKALREIGHVTSLVKDILMWAIRHEEPGVRIEAIHCIATLKICDPDIQYILRDRLVFDSHEHVQR
ncbi:hypothetical protein GDO86_016197 [Hymenochirus boettgeri]|uniref:HEAT repeat-containing protein 4 n=1 Tax=Hymenochirus boettgeri TaxID=247094 RepID=A0A8T2K496_9PIPI|nr:hypothetical protein GDO86_016197 [Hymenochirus boettgeri]